jgi:hypothetical protein
MCQRSHLELTPSLVQSGLIAASKGVVLEVVLFVSITFRRASVAAGDYLVRQGLWKLNPLRSGPMRTHDPSLRHCTIHCTNDPE